MWLPEGVQRFLGRHACYDPAKDLLVPPMFSPFKVEASPILGNPRMCACAARAREAHGPDCSLIVALAAKERDVLGFFKGRLLMDEPQYSLGTRQAAATLAASGDWWGKHRIFIGEEQPKGDERSYSDLLASSIFCFAFRGGLVGCVALRLQAASGCL